MHSVDEWEGFKENVVPLREGRKPEMLSELANKTPDQRRRQLEVDRQKYIDRIAESDNDDDPLEAWVQYANWLRQVTLEGNKSPELLSLYEQCAKHFMNDNRYKNDTRFVRICLQYVECCDEPLPVLRFMMDVNIGENLALYYESYAVVLEKLSLMKEADEVFLLGIHRNAQPLERLKKNYELFKRRLASHLLATPSSVGSSFQQEPPVVRPALFTLASTTSTLPLAVSSNIPSTVKKPSSTSEVLSIFQEPSTPSGFFTNTPSAMFTSHLSSSRIPLQTVSRNGVFNEDARLKENRMQATQWTQGPPLPSQASTVTLPPPVSIYQDEDITFSNIARLASGQNEPKPTVEEPKKRLPVKDDLKPNEKRAYSFKAVFDQYDEFSFEELRAKKYRVKQIPAEKLEIHSVPLMSMTKNQSFRDSVLTPQMNLTTKNHRLGRTSEVFQELKSVTEEESLLRPSLQPPQPLLQHQQIFNESFMQSALQSNAEPTLNMTVNTKKAIDDIMPLFQQPLNTRRIFSEPLPHLHRSSPQQFLTPKWG